MPYIVAGSGGHARSVPTGEQKARRRGRGASSRSQVGPVLEYGYLTVTVDMTTPPRRF